MSFWKTREAREYVEAALHFTRANTEKCREQALAITKLEEADMWLRVLFERQQEAEQGDDDIAY